MRTIWLRMAASESGARSARRVVIDARRSLTGPGWGELWDARDLWWQLSARDLQVRYRQAVIGLAWAVLRPAAAVLVFVVFFGLLDRLPSTAGVPYAATALAGWLAWQLFATTVSDLSDSLVKNRSVLTKVYFPRVLIPLSAATVPLVDAAVALVPAIVLMAWVGVDWGWAVVLTPVWLAGVWGCGLSLGILLSALNAQYRDVGQVVPFALQLGFLATPVIYETTAIIPSRWLPAFWLNPLAGLLDGLRWSLVGAPPPNVWSVVWAAVVLALGGWGAWTVFHRLDQVLADRI